MVFAVLVFMAFGFRMISYAGLVVIKAYFFQVAYVFGVANAGGGTKLINTVDVNVYASAVADFLCGLDCFLLAGTCAEEI